MNVMVNFGQVTRENKQEDNPRLPRISISFEILEDVSGKTEEVRKESRMAEHMGTIAFVQNNRK